MLQGRPVCWDCVTNPLSICCNKWGCQGTNWKYMSISCRFTALHGNKVTGVKNESRMQFSRVSSRLLLLVCRCGTNDGIPPVNSAVSG